MKSIFIMILVTMLVASPFSQIQAQLEPFGLPGETINKIALFPKEIFPNQNYLCAGSHSNGVFIRNLISPDSLWVNIGLLGKEITAMHAHLWGAGPAELISLYVGVRPNKALGDSTLLYLYTFILDTSWMAADSGLNPNSIDQINAISGFFFGGHSPAEPIFAATGGDIFRSISLPWFLEWNNVWTMGGSGIITIIHVHRIGVLGSDGTVWAGGETGFFQPVIVKSIDKGANWDVFYPDLGGDNACISIAVDPLHPDTVYAGIRGAVIKTIDGGLNWTITALQNTPYYFLGMVINPDNPAHVVAGGPTGNHEFGLFETFDGGDNWTAILETDSISGISSMDAHVEGNEFVVYMGTLADGIYRYKTPLTGIEHKTELRRDFTLYQNYPNPFNPTTTISWQLAVGSDVELAIYNLLGQRVRTLVNGREPAGRHQVKWDGRNDTGSEIASGIYLCRIKAGTFVKARKLILLR